MIFLNTELSLIIVIKGKKSVWFIWLTIYALQAIE